ncbi:putative methanogen marker protein 4 [Methanococcus voltae PS]|uniref:Methanogen marker protein 4 n=1 Tax=Methanococcus voltae PS TaxID=523842 RepID=A0ABT2EWM5_METVO|nr:methanogenesis marker protein Mmp4/MtxX [Methanococcus voltae]MCS3922358.1 putative methanogen marker protein 4 [Methanococcus voltae PS]
MYILGYDKDIESSSQVLEAYNRLISEDINVKLVESPQEFLKLFKKYISNDLDSGLKIDENNEEIEVISGFVRGNLSSSKIMPEVKNLIKKTFDAKFYRASILKNPFMDKYFILAPVGIDEFSFEYKKRIDDKIEFIDYLVNYLKKDTLKYSSNNNNEDSKITIGLLSGGRLSDLGRDPHIDNTICECKEIVNIYNERKNLEKELKKNLENVDVIHDGILIEEYLKKGFDVIIAPDGISGNLIFRSLALVCGLEGCGALLVSKKPINFIDTSRSGNYLRYYNAVKYLNNQK